jgi:hypothetical protein
VWVVRRFNQPIFGLLKALQKRIDAGSTVRAGPFEISDQFRPLDPKDQKEKLREEVAESLAAPGANEGSGAPSPSTAVMELHLQAEDLVLRVLQAEIGTPINRQVTAGSDFGFDGAYVKDGSLHIIEVKFLSRPDSIARLRRPLDRMLSVVRNYHWRNVRIILALVVEDQVDTPGEEAIRTLTEGTPVPVEVRVYSLTQLRHEFGGS